MVIAKLEVFDPPMCCSSGVCGPKVDPALPRFAADLEWVKSQGVAVKRYNLAQQPMAFAGNEAVRMALTDDENCLPLLLVDGKVVSRGKYPSRDELAVLVGIIVCTRNMAADANSSDASALADPNASKDAGRPPALSCYCGPRTAGRRKSSCCG